MTDGNRNEQPELQDFLARPHTLREATFEGQLAIANHPDTPRELLEILVSSDTPQIAEAARLHVNWTGGWTSTTPGDWHTEVDRILQTTPLGQNDRLAVELLKLGPVPPACFSEWIPANVWTKALQHPHMPLHYQIQMVERSAQDPRLELRLHVAKSPNTPIAVLEQLVGDIEFPVRLAAQTNPHCPSKQIKTVKAAYEQAAYWYTYQAKLAALGQSRWAWIRLVVAQNPSTPESTLATLAHDNYVKIKLAVMQNPVTPESILAELAKDPDVQKTIATHRIKIDKFPSWAHYRTHLTQERATEEQKEKETLARLGKSPQALARIVKKGDRRAKIDAARSDLPVELLVKLAQDPDESVRSAVSKNPNLPLEQLLVLAQDSNIKIRTGLAQYSSRQSPPIPVLEQLALDESSKVRTLVAQNQHTPVEILEQLAQDHDRDVLIGLSRNPKTPALLLELLASQTGIVNPRHANTPANAFVIAIETVLSSDNPRGYSNYKDKKLGELLKSSHTPIPSQLLEKLADYPRDWIRSRVAFHTNTPASALDRLADDNYDSARWGVAQNLNTSNETVERLLANETPARRGYRSTMDYLTRRSSLSSQLFERLANHDDPNVRQAIARRHDFPTALSDQCAETETEETVLQALAWNPTLTPHALSQLLQKPYPAVHLTLARHPNLSVDHWQSLLGHPSAEVRCCVAVSSTIPPELLVQLTTDDREEVRYTLVSNPNVPIQIFQQLVNDPILKIRRAIASNPSTPASVLAQLAEDNSIDVRQTVVENPNTPMEVRDTCFSQENPYLQAFVAAPTLSLASPTLDALPRRYNPKTDDLPELLREYAQADNAFVRLAAFLHPLTPVEVLEEGVRSPLWLERYAIAANPTATPAMCQILTQDANWLVRACAHEQ